MVGLRPLKADILVRVQASQPWKQDEIANGPAKDGVPLRRDRTHPSEGVYLGSSPSPAARQYSFLKGRGNRN